MPLGAENSKLSSLFSITPFEEKEVTLEGFLTDCCDAVREKEGTIDKIPALDIPSRIRALSSGGDTEQEDGLIDGTLTTYTNDRITNVRTYAFYTCNALTSVDLPNATSIGESAFYSCSNLTSVDLPNATNIGNYAFQHCSSLTSVDLPNAISIGSSAFESCYSLTKLIIRTTSQTCTLSSTSAFSSCYHILGTTNATYNPEGLKDGYIYVPDELVESYKTATNWVTYAGQIKPLSELGE